MALGESEELAALITSERDMLLSQWRLEVRQLPSARHLDIPTLNDHIPILLDDLVIALQIQSDETIVETIFEGSPAHGVQRVQDGFDIVEVVAEYNILRGCINHLADRHGVSLQGKRFDVINRVLDGAIASAVKAFADERALEVQRRREDYLAFVAHDLRTPLSAITMAVAVLERIHPQPNAAPGSDQMLKVLNRNVQQIKELVSKVLEENINLQTEIGVKLERRICDLWSLVEALIYDLHPVAGTNSTRLINNVPEDLVVYADASLLRRIFQNLIANAIKYTPRGEVQLGARDVGPAGVECWVTDNGAGIPADLIANVFDKGESDPEKDGTGLGLAIVKTFVEAHGGQIGVESKEGVGSTFRFRLPKMAS